MTDVTLIQTAKHFARFDELLIQRIHRASGDKRWVKPLMLRLRETSRDFLKSEGIDWMVSAEE